MDKKFLKYIGHDLYNVKKLKERKRYIVFRIRCGLHKSQIGALLDFFQTTPLRRDAQTYNFLCGTNYPCVFL